jgi:acyl-CoA synthetase (AMP-forming)/AMP-acid ligase II
VWVDTPLERAGAWSDANPASSVTPDHLAYVIYTSGSTGTPKGVLVNHSNVVRLFAMTWPWFRFDGTDVWTLFHSYTFDFSVWEMWGALCYGGRLVIVPYWVAQSPQTYYDLLCQEQVTVLNQTPSALYQLIGVDEERSAAGRRLALRLLIVGGEALDIARLKPWFQRHGDAHPRLVNMYGITETTVHVTYPTLAPSISSNPILLNGSATASAGASDSGSGVASQSCGPINTATVGARTVTCTATDNAGNTASATLSYQVIYNFTGFFQPVDNLPTLNQVTAGRAIPVKFSLGGNQGLGIFASGSPTSGVIACSSTAPIDPVEQTVTAGNSGLSYDAATGIYTYTWKTDKAWANSCRQLAVKLIDGQTYRANFKFVR